MPYRPTSKSLTSKAAKDVEYVIGKKVKNANGRIVEHRLIIASG